MRECDTSCTRRPRKHPSVTYVVLGLAFAFESGAWGVAYREFNSVRGRYGIIEAMERGKDPTTFTVLIEDSAALLGLLVAFGGVLLTQLSGNAYFDGIASVRIGVILAFTAFWLARETKGLLIGESANPELVKAIRQLASEYSQITTIGDVLTTHLGPYYILVNLKIEMRDDVACSELQRVTDALETRIRALDPRVKRVFVRASWGRRTVDGASTPTSQVSTGP